MIQEIIDARKAYLNNMPDLVAKAKTMDSTALHEEIAALSVKFGNEFVAHVRTAQEINDWLIAVEEVAGGSYHILKLLLTSALHAALDPYIYAIDHNPDMLKEMQQRAISTWEEEF